MLTISRLSDKALSAPSDAFPKTSFGKMPETSDVFIRKCAVPSSVSPQFGQLSRMGQETMGTTRLLEMQANDPAFQVDTADKASEMPAGFRGRHAQTPVVALGTGHLYFHNLSAGRRLDHLQGPDAAAVRYYYDPGLTPDRAAGMIGQQIRPATDTPVLVPENIPDHSIVLVLSPTRFHADQLVTLLTDPAIKHKVTGIYCEKPMVAFPIELEKLEQALRISQTPVYFSDRFYAFGLGAVALLGKKVPYKDFLVIEDDPKGILQKALERGESVLGPIHQVKGRMLLTADLIKDNREWLMSRSQGGGVMTDVMIHPMNFFHLLGLKMDQIEGSYLYALNRNSISSSELSERYVPIRSAPPDEAENYVI